MCILASGLWHLPIPIHFVYRRTMNQDFSYLFTGNAQSSCFYLFICLCVCLFIYDRKEWHPGHEHVILLWEHILGLLHLIACDFILPSVFKDIHAHWFPGLCSPYWSPSIWTFSLISPNLNYLIHRTEIIVSHWLQGLNIKRDTPLRKLYACILIFPLSESIPTRRDWSFTNHYQGKD